MTSSATIPDYRVQAMFGAGPFDIAGDAYLELTGTSGSRASTPDHSSLDVTTDISGAVEFETPVAFPTSGVGYEVISKYVGTGNQRSWHLRFNTTGAMVLFWSADGSTVLSATSSPLPRPLVGNLTIGWWLDVNNGAAGRTITFYARAGDLAGLLANLSTSILGTAVVQAGTTSVFSSTAPLDIGDLTGSSDPPYPGKIRKAQFRNGNLSTGTIVANPDFDQPIGTTSFTDSAGRLWSINSPAAIVGFDWETIPDAHVKSLRWEDGRSNELDQFRATTATITLRNNDRLYDPEYTAGAHFGDLNPRVPFRIQLHDGAAWVDQWYGFVKGGWRQEYIKPDVSTCVVELSDMLDVLESEPLATTAYEVEVLSDSPRAYWTLDQSDGEQMTDSSGHGRHGFFDNATLGQEPLIAGNGHSMSCLNDTDSRGRWSGQGLPVGANCTLEAWVKLPRELLDVKSIIVAQRDTSLGNALWFKVDSSVGSPNGELLIHFHGLGGYKARGHTRVDDDQRHHVVCTIAGTANADVLLYVDSVLQTKTTVTAGSNVAWPGLLIWTVGNAIDSGVGDYGLGGLIDEVAIYDVALSAARIAAHYEAGSTGYSGDWSGDRIDRVLDYIRLPESMRDIATGDTTVGPAIYGGTSAGAYLQKVVESEQGVLYVDHRGGGKLKFRGRYHRLTESRSTTSQTTFDPCHFDETIVPEPNGIETVVNVVDVNWSGGKETVTDDTSRRQYGAQSRSIDTEAPTASVARNAGFWLIARYKDPQTRLRSLPLKLAGQPELWDTILDLRVGDRVTVQRHPQEIGAAINNELIVEGSDRAMNEDRSWVVDFRLSNADDTDVALWGTAVFGTDTFG